MVLESIHAVRMVDSGSCVFSEMKNDSDGAAFAFYARGSITAGAVVEITYTNHLVKEVLRLTQKDLTLQDFDPQKVAPGSPVEMVLEPIDAIDSK